MHTNYIIYAIGQKGEVEGKVFIPYRETDGSLPIFSENFQGSNGSAIQKSENKVKGIVSISEAVKLVRSGRHRWRLKEHTTGQVNIYKPEHIHIFEL
jgi:hypothetical protein